VKEIRLVNELAWWREVLRKAVERVGVGCVPVQTLVGLVAIVDHGDAVGGKLGSVVTHQWNLSW
jgi:hypothetical protein